MTDLAAQITLRWRELELAQGLKPKMVGHFHSFCRPWNAGYALTEAHAGSTKYQIVNIDKEDSIYYPLDAECPQEHLQSSNSCLILACNLLNHSGMRQEGGIFE